MHVCFIVYCSRNWWDSFAGIIIIVVVVVLVVAVVGYVVAVGLCHRSSDAALVVGGVLA